LAVAIAISSASTLIDSTTATESPATLRARSMTSASSARSTETARPVGGMTWPHGGNCASVSLIDSVVSSTRTNIA
jgi:hypothetical protein